MSTISIRLPNYLHNTVRQLADKEDVSINQFITLAVAEKISALMTEDFIEKKAKKGSREKFEAVLAKVPNVEPEEFDRIK